MTDKLKTPDTSCNTLFWGESDTTLGLSKKYKCPKHGEVSSLVQVFGDDSAFKDIAGHYCQACYMEQTLGDLPKLEECKK